MKGVPVHLPALVAGATVAAYWWQVMRMAARSGRRRGQSANLIPAEPLGRRLRILWTPVVLIWVVVPFAVAGNVRTPRALFHPMWQSLALTWPAAIIVACCWLMTRACWRQMGKSWRMGINPTEKTALVASGAYACVRHPIYSLSQLMIVATAVAAPAPLLMGAAIVHVALMQWEARREEAFLLSLHGDIYRSYCDGLPRFIPSKISLLARACR